MSSIARRIGLRRQRLTRFRWFDYLSLHPDLVATGIDTAVDAAAHFAASGGREGRRWYLRMPRELLRSIERCDPTDGGWQVDLPTPVGRRRSVEAALRTLPSDQWVIAAHARAYGHPPGAAQLDAWCAELDAGARTRLSVYAEVSRLSLSTLQPVAPWVDPEIAHAQEWHLRAAAARAALPHVQRVSRREQVAGPARPSADIPAVSVVCSLYRTDTYLDQFLGNILEQTIFHECEFLMVLVDPSPFERETLEQMASDHPNVHLDTVPQRIGIYEAWNRAVRVARGRYLTNMNADDIRRADSLERQRALLDAAPWADVMSQDVFVSFDPTTPWEILELVGDRTNFPPATPTVFMSYVNPPHNAPMWRRSLHDRFGLFDEQFASAGDADFWIRCARGGALFLKDREIHVGYYRNPSGLSTAPNGVGIREHRSIIAANVDLLPTGASPRGLLPPKLGAAPEPRADRVTRAFIDRLATHGRSRAISDGGAHRIVLDDHALAIGDERARVTWSRVLEAWTPARLAELGIDLTIIDRSGVFSRSRHRVLRFPERSWNAKFTAADRVLLTRLCEYVGADLFISTSHTFAIGTPTVLVDPTHGQWRPTSPPLLREALEMELAAAVAVRIDGSSPDDILAGVVDTLAAPVARPAEFHAALDEMHQLQIGLQR